MCPDGYFYAGEDTEKLPKDIWLEEKDRSPEYSCYKVYFFQGYICILGWLICDVLITCGDIALHSSDECLAQ